MGQEKKWVCSGKRFTSFTAKSCHSVNVGIASLAMVLCGFAAKPFSPVVSKTAKRRDFLMIRFLVFILYKVSYILMA